MFLTGADPVAKGERVLRSVKFVDKILPSAG